MISFLRVIKFALQDVYRNLSLSSMTVLILILMLLSVNTLVIVRLLTTEATNQVKNQIDMSVYFKPDATDKDITTIRSYIGSLSQVSTSTFYTPDQVLLKFKENNSENEAIISSLDELSENPFGATLVIIAREPQDYQQIIAGLEVPDYADIIEDKTFADTAKATNRIHDITSQAEQFTYVVTCLFALIAFIVIFNTIRVAIYTQRTEIGIKKLVGASNWFVRGPFIIEALLFSAVSVAATAGLVFLAASFLDPYIGVVLHVDSFLTKYFFSHILLLFGAQFLAVLFLTIASSSLAMRRYLRV